MRGEVYCIEGLQIFTFGGYSIDKYRRQENVSWWSKELPTDEEYLNAEENLKKIGYQVDFIITHTATSESVYYLSTLRSLEIRNDVIEELPLTTFLDGIQQRVEYKHWYFGHFHVDTELWRNQSAIQNSVLEIVSEKVVHRREFYEA